MKLNNKGFAISIILYSMIAVITLVLLLIVTIYATNVHNKLSQADRVKQKISGLETLNNRILNDNSLLEVTITLTNTSRNDVSGLYKSIATTSGQPTYYFRGNVTNNYIKFGKDASTGKALIWRIVRINEDKTVRIILDNSINTSYYVFYEKDNNKINGMYYSNTGDPGPNSRQVKYILDRWYDNNLKNNYGSKVSIGDYFCEQNKVASTTYTPTTQEEINNYKSNPVLRTNYTYPDFRCSKDGNEHGLVNSAVGLISYDEVVFAGGNTNATNTNYYLYNGITFNESNNSISTSNRNNNYNWFTMSPNNPGSVWYVTNSGQLNTIATTSPNGYIRPVINLRSNVIVTKGNGNKNSPYEVN